MKFKSVFYCLCITGLFGVQWGYAQNGFLKPISTIQDPKIVEYPSSYVDQKIRLEYKQDTRLESRHELTSNVSGTYPYMRIIKGNETLVTIIKMGIYSNGADEDQDTKVVLDFDPACYRMWYDVYLKYPEKEDKEKVLSLISSPLGFTYNKEETTVKGYKATWNGQSISFPTTSREFGLRPVATYHFENMTMDDLFRLYSSRYKVQIQNATNITDTFTGYIPLYPSFDEAQRYFQDKTGVSFNAVDSKIIKISFKAN